MTTLNETANTRLAPSLTGAPSRSVHDIVLLGMRLGAAAVFIPHGRGDILDAGVSTNIDNSRVAKIPLPELGAHRSPHTSSSSAGSRSSSDCLPARLRPG